MPCGDGATRFVYMQRYFAVRVNTLGKGLEGYYCTRRDAYYKAHNNGRQGVGKYM